MKTTYANSNTVERKCYIIDASDQILGRLAVRAATILSGKHKPTYTPHVDTGDMVVVTNADKIKVTGRKLDQKEYQRYSGYPSGQKVLKLKDMLEKKSERVIELAVKRMLPKNRLGSQMFKKLYVYSGSEHPHAAQKPETLEVS